MTRETSHNDAISRIVFDERYAIPGTQPARPMVELPPECASAGDTADAMATAYLIALLESICIRELQCFIDPADETIVGTAVDCRHCAPVAAGAMLRVSGWVERSNGDEVRFRVQAQDEQERVCEGSISLAIVHRDRISLRILRKREAIARRELFVGA
ncbi:MAG: hypothetical protein ABI981_00765 [Betaproteobacteria bacterium]